MEQLFYWLGGIIVLIISYFLKKSVTDSEKSHDRAMAEIDGLKKDVSSNKDRIILLENNHIHLTDKFDLLYDAVRELTKEIKNLNIQLSRKKDI